jgi:hypothetical protein
MGRSLPSGLDGPAIRIGSDCKLVFPMTLSIALGNSTIVNFAASAANWALLP